MWTFPTELEEKSYPCEFFSTCSRSNRTELYAIAFILKVFISFVVGTRKCQGMLGDICPNNSHSFPLQGRPKWDCCSFYDIVCSIFFQVTFCTSTFYPVTVTKPALKHHKVLGISKISHISPLTRPVLAPFCTMWVLCREKSNATLHEQA